MEVQISDVQELSRDNPPLQSDVLYTVEQNQMLQYQGMAAKGPVLCIAHTGWALRHSQATFPVLIVVLCQNPGQVYAALGRLLYQEGASASQMPEVSAEFLRCRSLDALIEKGYAYLGNPFAIHDSAGKLLAYSRQAGLRDEHWRSSDFQASVFGLHSVENASSMERSRAQQLPVLLPTKDGSEQLRMALSSRGQTLGYLTVLSQFRPFTRTDLQIAELLGCFVTLDLLRQSSITRVNTSGAGCLKSFLEAGEVNMPGVSQWLAQQSCDAGQHNYLLLFNSAGAQNDPFFDVDQLLEQLQQQFPGDIATRLEAGVVLLVKRSGDIGDLTESVKGCMASGVRVGISVDFQNLMEAGHGALRQARSALELGSRLSPEDCIYCYGDYTVYVGLHAAADRMDLRELLPMGLRELMKTDDNGEMLRTLEAYLSTGGRKARAAELLFIHLNTLKYRLSALSSRLNMDLDDPAVMFSLRYALHVIKYLQCFGGQ